MTFLVDSRILRWAALDDPRLRGAARESFMDPSNQLLVSVPTLWELGTKYALGKLPLPLSARDFFAREVAVRGYTVCGARTRNEPRNFRFRTLAIVIRSTGCSWRRRSSKACRC